MAHRNEHYPNSRSKCKHPVNLLVKQGELYHCADCGKNQTWRWFSRIARFREIAASRSRSPNLVVGA